MQQPTGPRDCWPCPHLRQLHPVAVHVVNGEHEAGRWAVEGGQRLQRALIAAAGRRSQGAQRWARAPVWRLQGEQPERQAGRLGVAAGRMLATQTHARSPEANAPVAVWPAQALLDLEGGVGQGLEGGQVPELEAGLREGGGGGRLVRAGCTHEADWSTAANPPKRFPPGCRCSWKRKKQGGAQAGVHAARRLPAAAALPCPPQRPALLQSPGWAPRG